MRVVIWVEKDDEPVRAGALAAVISRLAPRDVPIEFASDVPGGATAAAKARGNFLDALGLPDPIKGKRGPGRQGTEIG